MSPDPRRTQREQLDRHLEQLVNAVLDHRDHDALQHYLNALALPALTQQRPALAAWVHLEQQAAARLPDDLTTESPRARSLLAQARRTASPR